MKILVNKFISLYIKLISKFYFSLYSKTDLNNKTMLFESAGDFSDNALALFEYIVDSQDFNDWEIAWIVDNPELYREKYPNIKLFRRRPVNILDLKEKCKFISRCRYFFFTHPAWFKKLKNEQIIINLWHGCGYKAAKGISINFDKCLVPGPLFIKTKAEFFGCDESQIWDIGYPRYKWLSCSKKDVIKRVKSNFDFNEDDKIVIWMPTYRKTFDKRLNEETLSSEFDLPIIQNINEIKFLDKLCKEMNITLLIKRHRMENDYNLSMIELNNIKFIDDLYLENSGIKLYELLSITDGLITDYSSVAFDYLLVNKPIAFTLDDYVEYKESRGFVFDNPLEYMPGNHIYNMDNMREFLNEIHHGIDKYIDHRMKVKNIAIYDSKDYCKEVLTKLNILKNN